MKLDILACKIFIATFMSNVAYGIIAPIVPIIFKQKGVPLNAVALIFAAYSVSMIIVSPIVPFLMRKSGQQFVIKTGLLLFGICLICFGTVQYMHRTSLIVAYSTFLRALQGVCSALIQTSCYAVAANHYPDDKEEVIGYLEAIMGIGNGLGPFLGALLYTLFGFDIAFYTFGATLILFVIVTQIVSQSSSTPKEKENNDFQAVEPTLTN